jgi:hypothetical protein
LGFARLANTAGVAAVGRLTADPTGRLPSQGRVVLRVALPATTRSAWLMVPNGGCAALPKITIDVRMQP